MKHSTKSHRLLGPLSYKSAPIITTLYELIETVNEEIKPGEEHWVYFISRMTVLKLLYQKKGPSGLTKKGVKNENNSKNYGGV